MTKIEEGLKTVNEKLDEMLQWKAGFEERCVAHKSQTEEVRNTLFGDRGCNGMVKQVDRLVQCKGELSRWRDFRIGLFKIVVAAAIISLVSWLLFIYRLN